MLPVRNTLPTAPVLALSVALLVAVLALPLLPTGRALAQEAPSEDPRQPSSQQTPAQRAPARKPARKKPTPKAAAKIPIDGGKIPAAEDAKPLFLSREEAVGVYLADLKNFSEHDRYYIRYINWQAYPGTIAEIEAIQAFIFPHLSSEIYLEGQIPHEVVPGIYRIDLREIGWSVESWLKLSRLYRYSGYRNPNILDVRGDWLIYETADAEKSTLYYDLLYSTINNGKAPSDRAEFLKLWKVDGIGTGLEQAHIINRQGSGVSHETRLVVYALSANGYYWETFDSERATGKKDPIVQLEGGLEFDAMELIAAMPKINSKTGDRCYAQAYLLTDGQQKRVEEAAVRVVVDHSDRIPAVRTPGSCIRCHHNGILDLGPNLAREIIRSGNRIYAKRGFDKKTEAKFLGDLARATQRNQEDFGLLLKGYTDLSTTETVGAYTRLLKWYESNLTLAQAARELYTTPEELRLAIGYYAGLRPGDKFLTRLNMLAEGTPIPRFDWEDQSYLQAYEALKIWREDKR